MNARERLARTRVQLGVAGSVAAVLWGIAAVVLGVTLAGVLAQLRGGDPRVSEAVAFAAGLGVTTWRLLRLRPLRSAEQVALWLEERRPPLRYALVTLAGEGLPAPDVRAVLEAAVAAQSWAWPVRTTIGRVIALPLVAIAVTGMLLAASTSRVGAAAVARTAAAVRRAGGARAMAPGFTGIVARITPPAYTGRGPFTIAEPSVIGAIEASEVVLDGPAGRGPVAAVIGGDTVRAGAAGARWHIPLVMPESALALRLVQGTAERLVILEPVPDSAPVVTLEMPGRDTVLRAPEGRIVLTAGVHDDLGLAASWFEVIVSSGERETFTFRTAALAQQDHHGARTARRETVLRLDSLALVPGDVVSLRAVARDANPAAGRGVGVSETRTLRIARPGEYDSLALEGLPPIMGDTAALSQRMLIMLAEALERRRPRLSRDTVVGESRRIARDQAQLRRRVADIVFMRLGGETAGEESEGPAPAQRDTPEAVMAAAEAAAGRDASAAMDFAESESPVVAVNRPLLEAYNAMWDATRALEIGEPGDALPHMRAALEAIERARQSERLYLRGRPPVVVVDLARVRLAGDRAGAGGSRRQAGTPLPGERARLAARFAAAVSLLEAGDAAAADTLLLLRLDALRGAPRFAAALARAASDLRTGHDATAALRDARQALGGHEAEPGPLAVWSGAW